MAGNKATTAELSNSGILSPGATDFLNNQGYDNSKPKAYVNWILFDEQFKYVSSNSGFEQVGDGNEYSTHTRTNLPVDKSGYLYIYVSNETPNIDVFFDNLQVTHIRGPILEETHYYPFGLAMSGISSKALNFGNVELKQKFVGQELDEELDVNWYQFRYRNHDPQIGRFIQIDPLASDYTHNSTYAYAENRVIDGIDLEGLEYISKIKKFEYNGSGWDYPKAVGNAFINIGNLIPELWNSGVANYQSIRRGTWAKDMAGELKQIGNGIKDNAINTWEYTISTPLDQQFVDAWKMIKDPRTLEYGTTLLLGTKFQITSGKGNLFKAEIKGSENIAVYGINGAKYELSEIGKMLSPAGEESTITLYRGMKGGESGKGLFLTTSEEYAKAYSGNVSSFQISKFGFNKLLNEDILKTLNGIHAPSGKSGLEVLSNSDKVSKLLMDYKTPE